MHRDGAFAEFIAVPARALHRLPAGVSFRAAAFLEPVAASLAVFNTPIQSHERGLIFGENRIARLTQNVLEAHAYFNTAIRGANDSALVESDAFDFAIDTLGTTEALRAIVEAVRPGGTIILKSRPYKPVEFIPE